jgi:hypothetical protein
MSWLAQLCISPSWVNKSAILMTDDHRDYNAYTLWPSLPLKKLRRTSKIQVLLVCL